MRLIASGIGVLLSLGVMAVSAVVNARYGMTLARDSFDQTIMMAAAVFADVGKAVSWIFFASAVARREVLASLASFLIFGACLIYAVSGSLGYVAINRAQSTATIEAKGIGATTLDAELARQLARLAGLGPVEPVTVAAKQIEAMKQDRRFGASKQCHEAVNETMRSYCAGLAHLEGDEQRAQAAASLEDEIANLRRRRDLLGGVAVADKGDFQGALIAQLTNLKLTTIQVSLALLFVVLVESGSCFLLWLSLNHGEGAIGRARAGKVLAGSPVGMDSVTPLAALMPPQTQPAASNRDCKKTIAPRVKAITRAPSAALTATASPGDFVVFVERCLDLAEDGRTEVSEIARAYQRWCQRSGCPPLSDELIADSLQRFCRAGGVAQSVQEGKIYLLCVVLTNDAHEGGRRQKRSARVPL